MTRCIMVFVAAALLQPVKAPPKPLWLDQPPASWNTPGMPVPRAPKPPESLRSVISRCRLTPPSSEPAAALAAAGWIPFNYFGNPMVQGDIVIVGGMSGADGMCRPTGYNVFVFVGSRHAGTLSPAVMSSRENGSSGEIHLVPPEIRVNFARYAAADPLCCPSSQTTVRFRIDRTAAGPTVVPVEIKEP